jgi:hypothetical protein
VYRPGGVLRHPVTGAVVGETRTELASIKIVEVEATVSTGNISGSDKNLVRPGDKVRRKAS